MAAPRYTSTHHTWFVVGAVLLIMAGVGGYIAYDFWSTNQKTQAILGAPGIVTASDETNAEKAGEGVDTGGVSDDEIAGYKVAADEPRVITINAINVRARIKPMGLNTDNSIQAPRNINDAGWYTGSAKPGESGALFIDGHASASGAPKMGLFASLGELNTGAMITIEKGDGKQLTYRVVKVETVSLDSLNMETILKPYAGTTRGLTLMTCTGHWMKNAETLDHRVVVYAQQV